MEDLSSPEQRRAMHETICRLDRLRRLDVGDRVSISLGRRYLVLSRPSLDEERNIITFIGLDEDMGSIVLCIDRLMWMSFSDFASL